MLLLCLLIIISVLAIIFLTRLFYFKNEVKKIGKQLEHYNQQRTNKKIDMALLDQSIESLGVEINQLIDLHIKEKRERIRVEMELKQTIANMSHDLRTPLTSIKGYLQMAEIDEVSESERKEYISIATKRAERLEALLRDFFDLSVIESIDYQVKFERVNIKNVVIDCLMNFYDRFSEKEIVPIIDMPEMDLFISADESAVARIVENLVNNSLKHSDGNIIITLEEKDSRAVFTVKNDAHSLSKEEVDRIFDRFYMADKSRSGKNTGLGLSIVKSLMKKMGANVMGRLYEGQLSIICEWDLVKNES